MKKVTAYIAGDGKTFWTEKECRKYEADGCVEFEPLPKYGDHVPISDKALMWMIGGDGSCYYATETRLSRVHAHRAPHPEWATHLVYFGK